MDVSDEFKEKSVELWRNLIIISVYSTSRGVRGLKNMRVLVIGSGGREHTLVWKLKGSRMVSKVYAAPGNPGISLIANSVSVKADDIDGLINFVERHNIDLTVVGPEQPLANGIVDEFQKRRLKIFGPTKKAADLESSKVFAKEFMRKYHIPTAPFQVFDEAAEAISFVNSAPTPLVVKADGLAAGKGAIVCKNADQAIDAINKIMVDRAFGDAGDRIVIENFLEGQELSVMAFTDGKSLSMMLPSQDHKQIGENDTGPNTGGMGAYSPVSFIKESDMQFIKEHIMEPTIAGMLQEGRKYKGVLYAGLMMTSAGPKVVEFNCRFGDPETQAVLSLLRSDLANIMIACIEGNLGDIKDLKWNSGAAACVVLSSKGYPGKAETGKRIYGLRNYSDQNSFLFHSGTRREGRNWLTAGGRVIGVTSVDKDLRSALSKAYNVVDNIKFEGMYFRGDIGHRANEKVNMSRV